MRILTLLIGLQLALGATAAEAPKSITTANKATSNATTTIDPTEANIARVAAQILQRSHYSQMPFNDAVSAKFLERYLESWDSLHLHFLQSDVQEFDVYRSSLDDLTLKAGDTRPAHVIFARFMERFEQRLAYVTELLKTEKFDFTGNDRYVFNRKGMDRPKDLAEAKALWRQHLRYEVLQERLNAEKPKTVASTKPVAPAGKSEVAIAKKDGTKVGGKTTEEEMFKKILNRYQRQHRTLKELSDDEVFEIYLTALTHVYDPHSDYMGKSQMENFAINMKLSLVGIGALLQSEDGYCKIKELMPGPAMKSKRVKPGDRIVAVAQGAGEPVDVVEMKLSKVVDMIRGKKGSEVRLTIIPADAADPSVRKVVTLVRDEIKLEDQEAKAKIIDMPMGRGVTNRMGIINLPSFYADFGLDGRKNSEPKSTTTDVAKLLRKLKQEKIQGLILDLRRNGGGSLEEAIKLTGLFIKRGPVVQTKEPNNDITVDKDSDPAVVYDGPLIILTSRFSASASEILAGALQDYGRAVIVGDTSTFGKGTVQSLLQLSGIMDQNRLEHAYDPGALKITIRKFYRASGSSTQLKGVVPEVVLPSINNYAEIGEASMENALPWDTVDSAKFDKLNRVLPFVAELQKRSKERTAKEKDFAYLQEDIELFKKLQAEKSVSLNEAVRLKEKKELEARIDARKKERASRKEDGQKVYDITLKDVTLAGLPTPVAKTNEVTTASSDPSHAVDPDEVDSLADDKAADVGLEEAKRILADYLALLPKGSEMLSLKE